MASRGFIELLRLADLAESRKSGHHNLNHAQWLGVGFEVAGQCFVAPIGEVAEVLAMPIAITQIPLSQSWLVGIANVRGRLLPLSDLTQFLNLEPSAIRLRHRKVLVIDQPEIFSGILIDKVLGIKQFDRSDYVAESLPSDSPFLPYNHGKFLKEGEEWAVFLPSLLTKDARYLEAAI